VTETTLPPAEGSRAGRSVDQRRKYYDSHRNPGRRSTLRYDHGRNRRREVRFVAEEAVKGAG